MKQSSFFNFHSTHEQIFHRKQLWEVASFLPHYFSTSPFKVADISLSFPQTVLINPKTIYIGEGVKIDPFVVLKGPLYIGNNVIIRAGAYVREHTILEESVTIGHGVEVKQSWIGPNSTLSHHNYVGNSLIGAHVNLGASSVLSNVRLDKKEIILHYQGIKIPTGQKKWGAIIGDNTQVGAGVVLNPGTLLEPKTLIYNKQNMCNFNPKESSCFHS